MISEQNRRKALDLAWQEFTHCGDIRKGRVRPEILASWQRCARAGVDYTDGACHVVLSAEQLEQPRKKHEALIKTAKPFMNKLYEFVAGSGLVVFLSDESGLILESIGDWDVSDNASKVNLVTGTGWTEETVGHQRHWNGPEDQKTHPGVRQRALLCQAPYLDLFSRTYF